MKKVVLIAGCRIPFLKAGTDYQGLMSYELGKMAISGLLRKTDLSPAAVEAVVMGTVVHQLKTSNIARESALAAGIAYTAPCHTVSMACISANRAIADAADQIALGHARIVIAGGADSVSDIPISFPAAMRRKLFDAQKMRGAADYMRFAAQLRPSDFKPEVPTISEFTTGRTMGQDCDRLADRIGVSRQEQDLYALRSHQLAAMAQRENWLATEICAAEFAPHFMPVLHDNGIRGDSSIEKINNLPPAFSRPNGTITAANASFLTDGAAVVLLMEEQTALALGYKPQAYIRHYTFTAQNPDDELLLGPAYATARLLDQTQLNLSDIQVLEFHEAFAAQVLANIKCLESDQFGREKLQRSGKVGTIDMDTLNLWGGSLSIGHPFGATGARLLTTAASRLHREKAQFALVASCAAGALGHAMLLENYG